MNTVKISIVIPCYNMVDYIETTILSIINQKYANLELIIIDGCSTDGTLEILNNYKHFFSFYISEKDNGQYFAINKGLKIATGEIIAWLNADDIYFPWTFNIINKIFNENSNVKWVSGQSSFLDEKGNISKIHNNLSSKNQKYIQKGLFNGKPFGYLQQEGMFWKREVLISCGFLNTSLRLAADYELWIRFSNKYKLISIELPLAGFRIRHNSRSNVFKANYESEVNQLFKIVNKNRINRFIFKSCRSHPLNMFFRLFFWRKTEIYYFSVLKQKWVLSRKYRPIANSSISQLLLEL